MPAREGACCKGSETSFFNSLVSYKAACGIVQKSGLRDLRKATEIQAHGRNVFICDVGHPGKPQVSHVCMVGNAVWGAVIEKDLGVDLLSPSARCDATTEKAGKALYVRGGEAQVGRWDQVGDLGPRTSSSLQEAEV